MVKEIKTVEEFHELIKCGKLVICDFHAQWCGPCKTVAPKFAELAAENPDVEFCKIDVDVVPKAAEFAKVKAMPTFTCYKAGEELKQIVGANIAGIKKVIEAHK
ncbi:thioredoxin trx1 [Entomophthora muscae]|uniref:Thioredoxin trx1 n=1 Tax=Entomophthora muscae TaxID=34485 RepID=A0ACC2TIP1_9FUNG|nr:thioredoxin trx1 [Entomophthora muscae]